MADPRYALWHAEKKSPTPEDRRLDRTTDPHLMSGFWRINAARTLPDWPVAIWTGEGETATIFQIGHKIMRTDTHSEEWQSFLDKNWLKCTAVTQADWGAALDLKGPGRWPDGKPARQITAEEKADIIPTTPASQGGNAPVDENGAEIDEFWLQIKEGLERGIAQINELGPITSMEIATKGAEIVERMRALGGQGEAKRKEEKKPWDDGAKAVQNKWVPVLTPASEALGALVTAIDKFRRAEEERLRREKAESERKERERIAAEEKAKIAAEEAARAKQAEQMGMEHQAQSEEEIAAEAEARAAEQVAAAPQVETKVRVGTAHGRGVSKATVWGGEITDHAAFYEAVKDYPDVKEALQKVADRLGRANAIVPGYKRIQK